MGDGSHEATSWRRGHGLALDLVALGALGVVVGLLWGRARHTWYWLDEGIALGVSSHPLRTIPSLLRQDGSPPLYYMALHVWTALCGTSEGQTHLLSLLFALATVPAAWWAGWSLFGRRTGWMCALLAAVNPSVAAYANETRMYSLVILLGLLATATFLHAFVHRRRGYLPIFALSLLALMYTHNWGLLFGLGAAVAAVMCVALSTERRRLLVDIVLSFGAVALLYAPWVPTLLFQRSHTGLPSSPGPTLASVRNDLTDLMGGREVVVVLGLVAGWGLSGVLRRPWTRPAVAVLATATVPIVTIAAGWYAVGAGGAWVPRYLAAVAPPVIVLAAVGLGRGGPPAVVALAVVVFLTAPVAEKGPPYTKSNLRGIAERVSSRLRTGDLVISPVGEMPLLSHYLPGGVTFTTTSGPAADPNVADWRDITKRLRDYDPRTSSRVIAMVPLGGHVLVVCPSRRPAERDTEFARLNFLRCNETMHVAQTDTRLRLDMELTPPPEAVNAPTEARLFTKEATRG